MLKKSYVRAISQIIRTGHWITDMVTHELKEFDISEPQYNVLRILKYRRGQPLTVQEIQDKMVQRSSNVTRLIDKLLDKGLVNRQECATNRRKMDISITQAGLDLLVRLEEKVYDLHQPMAGNLTPSEAETLSELIIKLKGNSQP